MAGNGNGCDSVSVLATTTHTIAGSAHIQYGRKKLHFICIFCFRLAKDKPDILKIA